MNMAAAIVINPAVSILRMVLETSRRRGGPRGVPGPQRAALATQHVAG
jgi:hypothetical protein